MFLKQNLGVIKHWHFFKLYIHVHKKTQNIFLKVKTFFAKIYQSHEVLKIEEDLTFRTESRT